MAYSKEATRLLDEIGALGDLSTGFERVYEAAQDHAYFNRIDEMKAQLRRLKAKRAKEEAARRKALEIDMHPFTMELFDQFRSYSVNIVNHPSFEDVEEWVIDHLTMDDCCEILSREQGAAEALVAWIRDDGLGAWTEERDRAPEETFQEAIACWFHDLIGAPSPEGGLQRQPAIVTTRERKV